MTAATPSSDPLGFNGYFAAAVVSENGSTYVMTAFFAFTKRPSPCDTQTPKLELLRPFVQNDSDCSTTETKRDSKRPDTFAASLTPSPTHPNRATEGVELVYATQKRVRD